jgi:leucyl-tRNA synthetase
MEYEFKKIEKKWQNKWKELKTFEVLNPNYFVLSMWPYPSGKLHMGHLRNYLLGDVIARFKTLQGFSVLHPMGWDAFGLPAENAAIEKGIHPKNWTIENIKNMKEALNEIGFSFDWNREETSCLENYYKHEQKIFIDFFKHGLAYKKNSIVNWDPVDNTVLANEQVIDGKGWRSGAVVEKKYLSQWFLKISDFNEDLLDGLNTLHEWPEKVKIMQENWIGKSEGAEINFDVAGLKDHQITVFSTRPETLFGASFVGVSYSHPFALINKEAKSFVDECKLGSTKMEDIETAEKRGFFTGYYAINPLNNKKLPIYIANFVLMDYGTGALFGCPAHDLRDFEFATKYNLEIIQVVESEKEEKLPILKEGKIINSEFLNGLTTIKARDEILKKFNKKVNFKLKDWGVSRQRYWGCPIPMINCKSCGSVPVPLNQLPVKLPEDIKITTVQNPLKLHPTWRFTSCPSCGKDAERETDTLDTFFESSWYFLRFSGNGGESSAFENPIPVNEYIGGIEHAILHLLYARFFNRALKKIGYPVPFDEPFKKLITQGMVCHKTYQDLDGKWLTPIEASTMPENCVKVGASIKMSKSKKNVIEPAEIVNKFGADTARFFMASDTPPERDMEWSEEGATASSKFLNKFFSFASSFDKVENNFENIKKLFGNYPKEQKLFFKSLKLCIENLEDVNLNKSIANIREMYNIALALQDKTICKFMIKNILICMLPFTPHITSELWEVLQFKEDITKTMPIIFEVKEENVKISIQVNGKLRGVVEVSTNLKVEEEKIQILKLVNQEESILKYINEKQIIKEIHIPSKIFNFVVK